MNATRQLTLGSLFDGSGGFPLAGKIAGITPIWASEIEPFPIRVTTRRFPEMKHYGDVRKMDGAKIEPVDIITFGSPCQDLSIAGKRGGLEGERSGLFHEAMRIIKEMRQATNEKNPRYAVWENVVGAFSSNKGEDFRTVLEAFCSIKRPVSISRPRRWTPAGEIVGDGFSLVWRVFDAQYWGIPQRRKRIYLVADFAGDGAGKILFDTAGMSGNSEKSINAWKGATRRTENGTTATGNSQIVTFGICSYKSNSMLSDNPHSGFYKSETSRTIDRNGGNPCAHQGGMAVVYGISKDAFNQGQNARFAAAIEKELQPPIVASGPAAVAVYGINRETFHGKYDARISMAINENLSPTLEANGVGGVYTNMRVRRLTPLECCRLQGFPDWWCDKLETENPTEEELAFWRDVFETIGKNKTEKQLRRWLKNPRSDAAEYKMWGNGIALPCAVFVMTGIAGHDIQN